MCDVFFLSNPCLEMDPWGLCCQTKLFLGVRNILCLTALKGSSLGIQFEIFLKETNQFPSLLPGGWISLLRSAKTEVLCTRQCWNPACGGDWLGPHLPAPGKPRVLLCSLSTPILTLESLLKEFLLLEHSQWLKACLHVLRTVHLISVGLLVLIMW